MVNNIIKNQTKKGLRKWYWNKNKVPLEAKQHIFALDYIYFHFIYFYNYNKKIPESCIWFFLGRDYIDWWIEVLGSNLD
jgi:hypothetical protein